MSQSVTVSRRRYPTPKEAQQVSNYCATLGFTDMDLDASLIDESKAERFRGLVNRVLAHLRVTRKDAAGIVLDPSYAALRRSLGIAWSSTT